MLRVVLDTNVFVSSLLSRKGLPAQVLDAWRKRQYLLVISASSISEIRATLNYLRIREKYAIEEGDVDGLVDLLEHDALLVLGRANVQGAIPDDPKVEIFLASALEGKADMIVSGDQPLLELGEYQVIPILSVRRFSESRA